MSRVRPILGSFALLCAAILVAMFSGELLVRQIAPQKLYRFPQGLFVQLPQGGYTLTPNYSGISKTVEFDTIIKTNSLGLRSNDEYTDAEDDVLRVLVLGDSFTMGVGVNHDDTFVAKIGHALNSLPGERDYQLINAGVPGYNTSAALSLLELVEPQLEPDVVLLGYFIGNDVLDNYNGIPDRVSDGYLRRSADGPGLLSPTLKLYLRRHSHLYQLLWPVQRWIRDPAYREKRQIDKLSWLSIYDTRQPDEINAIWQSTKNQLRRFAEYGRETKTNIGVILIPDGIQSNVELWQAALKSLPESAANYRPDSPNRRLINYCEELELPVFDLLPAFAERADSAELYYAVDGHWTSAGNTVAANALLDFVSAGVHRRP